MDTKLVEIKGHVSYTEKIYFEIMDHECYNEEDLIERAVKTGDQIFFGKGFFDKNDNADEILKE